MYWLTCKMYGRMKETETERILIKMFEWSKNLSDKIAESGCLDAKEMQSVEIALRLLDIHDHVMNEAIGADDGYGEIFDLKYQILKNAKRK